MEDDILLLETDDPDRLLDRRETAHMVNQALSRLKRPQRELFVRHYYYGQTVQEAAQAMGLNQSPAKTWLRPQIGIDMSVWPAHLHIGHHGPAGEELIGHHG